MRGAELWCILAEKLILRLNSYIDCCHVPAPWVDRDVRSNQMAWYKPLRTRQWFPLVLCPSGCDNMAADQQIPSSWTHDVFGGRHSLPAYETMQRFWSMRGVLEGRSDDDPVRT